ncbi:DUF4215 domain-containing protein [Nannocystis sp. SCPEA4]|uniref:DUF4215 domain-containing protein n=1 Tax=Nannocystis sp. SCPEA4 TaxID=2996787 RepID=UPI00226F0067|nr:hypothetical protein [Nannocystis sp. SCPEA4]
MRSPVRIEMVVWTCLLGLMGCGPEAPTMTSEGGDTGAGSTTTGPSAPTEATVTDPAPPTSSTGPGSTVCGDGIVGSDEVCDDGNEASDDGCSPTCERTAAVAWTYTHDGAGKDDSATAVAVDATGRIIVAGRTQLASQDALLVALDPGGQELWRRTIDGSGHDDGFGDVVVDAAGTIFAGGYEETGPDFKVSVVRAFTPDGEGLWSFHEGAGEADFTRIEGLVVTDEALFSVGSHEVVFEGMHIVVRRHDLSDGSLAWVTTTKVGAPDAYAEGIALSGAQLVAVGYVVIQPEYHPAVVRLDQAGTIVSEAVEANPHGQWNGVTSIGDGGDVVLVGRLNPYVPFKPDVAVRRIGPDGVEKWTQLFDQDGLHDLAHGVAAGPDESIVVAAAVTRPTEDFDIFTGRFAGDGTLQWHNLFGTASANDVAGDVAIGPGFFVVAGYAHTPEHGTDAWVRRHDVVP